MGKVTAPKRSGSRGGDSSTAAKAQRYADKVVRAMGRELKSYRKKKGVDEKFMAGVLGITVKFYRRCEEGHGGRLPGFKSLLYANLYPLRERYIALSRFFGDPPPAPAEQKKWEAEIDAMSPEVRVTWESMLTLLPDRKPQKKAPPAPRRSAPRA